MRGIPRIIRGLVPLIPLFVFLVLAPHSTANAAGSCVFSSSLASPVGDPQHYDAELSFLCTSAANGTIASPTIVGDGASGHWTGFIRSVQITPGAISVPTDGYNVYVYGNPSTTRDMLGGLGVTSDNVTAKTDMPITSDNGAPYYLFNEVLTPAADSMGNATTTTIKLWIGR